MPAHIYLDNAATTKVRPAVCTAMVNALERMYGNPSSPHTMGFSAEVLVRDARRALAAYLRVPEKGIVFTSGGTESNNLAIFGTAHAQQRRGRHVVTCQIEHEAVLQPCAALERQGWRITRLAVNREGRIDLTELADAVGSETVLVTLMTVNNEVGTVQPIADIVRCVRARNPRTIVHTDAVQALGKVEIDPLGWGVDLVSLSSHKVHGPKGCGALWVREGTRLEPMILGGGQERGLRSGTESTPSIAGFGVAVQALELEGRGAMERMAALRKRLISGLRQAVPDSLLNGPLEESVAPHICNLAFPGIKAEVLVHTLSQEGVYVSTGAACSSRHSRRAGSHVLRAMGLSEALVDCSIRFSLSVNTSPADISIAVATVSDAVRAMRGGVREWK